MRTRGWEGNKPRRHTDRKAGGKGPGGPLYRLATLVKADARTCIRSVYEIALHQIHVQCSGEVQIFFRFDTLENHGKAKLVAQNLHLCTLGIVMLGGPLERGRRFPV